MAQLTYNSITFSNVDNTTPLVGVVNKYTIAGNFRPGGFVIRRH